MTEVTETVDGGKGPLSYPGHGAASYRAYVLGALLVVYAILLAVFGVPVVEQLKGMVQRVRRKLAPKDSDETAASPLQQAP